MRTKSRTRLGNHFASTIGTALGTVVAANSYRENLIIQNTGTATLYFGFGTAIGTGTALQLGTNTTFMLEQHVGPIYGVVGGGSTTVQIVELVEGRAAGSASS